MTGQTCRTTATDAGAAGECAELDAVLQPSTAPLPWAARRSVVAATFRGRLRPGWAHLPTSPLRHVEQGITFGLASAPVVLKSLSGSHAVPANIPWAVPSNGSWRIVLGRTTDLRLIHTDAVAMNAPASARRPFLFQDSSERAMRAAIKVSTPVWVDDRCRPVANLAALTESQAHASGASLRPVSPTVDHDNVTTFVMLAAWAFERQQSAPDPRHSRVVEHIDAHLADPGLSTDSVAAGCALSRRTVQALLADDGGVAGYIRRRRLTAVLHLLTADPGPLPDLDGVARATGFGSRRTLERAMRQVYGLTPRQARKQLLAGYPLRELEDGVLEAS